MYFALSCRCADACTRPWVLRLCAACILYWVSVSPFSIEGHIKGLETAPLWIGVPIGVVLLVGSVWPRLSNVGAFIALLCAHVPAVVRIFAAASQNDPTPSEPKLPAVLVSSDPLHFAAMLGKKRGFCPCGHHVVVQICQQWPSALHDGPVFRLRLSIIAFFALVPIITARLSVVTDSSLQCALSFHCVLHCLCASLCASLYVFLSLSLSLSSLHVFLSLSLLLFPGAVTLLVALATSVLPSRSN